MNIMMIIIISVHHWNVSIKLLSLEEACMEAMIDCVRLHPYLVYMLICFVRACKGLCSLMHIYNIYMYAIYI